MKRMEAQLQAMVERYETQVFPKTTLSRINAI